MKYLYGYIRLGKSFKADDMSAMQLKMDDFFNVWKLIHDFLAPFLAP